MHLNCVPKSGVIKYSDYFKNGGNDHQKSESEEEKVEPSPLPKVEKEVKVKVEEEKITVSAPKLPKIN
eukprot:CAMPEP_0205799102 /NCGR_PEP_ID=MMETSP0205-20121125/240_1 /ASSEMBLY_ACC=CAM_ASM_000278 /TAXON_ID=36767 /ORGANISM="Euplotes focardii, Strain TN1" /LENGTH=67 /DNA_ID=CAMNT_0053059813 /DNA_START=145 /DNA_END=348 /DNA_ORIENTATION=-